VTTAVSAYASHHPLFGFGAPAPPIPQRGPSGLAILRRLARAAATWIFPIHPPRGMASLKPDRAQGPPRRQGARSKYPKPWRCDMLFATLAVAAYLVRFAAQWVRIF